MPKRRKQNYYKLQCVNFETNVSSEVIVTHAGTGRRAKQIYASAHPELQVLSVRKCAKPQWFKGFEHVR